MMARLMKQKIVSTVLKRFYSTSEASSRDTKFDHARILESRTRHEYTHQKFWVKTPAMYGGKNTVTIIPGAGIGQELWAGVKEVLVACRAPLNYDEIDMLPLEDVDKCNDDFAHGIMSIKRNGVALKGGIESHACDPADYSRNVALRRNLDLYANVIEYKSYPGIEARYNDLDMVIVRQNSEGEYMMLEHEPKPGVVQNMKIVSEYTSERTARFAFNYAVRKGRKKITCTHRAHIMPLADGMFADSVERVSKDFPEIKFEQRSIANVAKLLTMKPKEVDMLILTNLSGSMITNMMMGFMGSPALLSGKNYGDDVAVFETGHRNKGESMAGKGIANPTAMLNAAIDMLEYLGHNYHACLIREALNITINEDRVHTFDLGGDACMQDVIDNVICRMKDVDACKCPVPESEYPPPAEKKCEEECPSEE